MRRREVVLSAATGEDRIGSPRRTIPATARTVGDNVVVDGTTSLRVAA